MKAKKSIIRMISLMCCAGTMASLLGGCGGSKQPEPMPAENGSAAETEAAEQGIRPAVKNDFEVNYGGWCPSAQFMTLTAADGAGYNGSRGMKLSGRKSTSDCAQSVKGMYLTGGVEYTYSVMVYSDTAETFHVKLGLKDKFGNEMPAELANTPVEAGKWTELSKDFTAPEGTGVFKLTIYTDSENDFSFDDVTVTPKDEAAAAASEAAVTVTEKGLKDEFAPYFRVGNILNVNSVKDSGITKNILKNYNSITCENETKPDGTLVQSLCTDDNIAVSINNAAAIFDFCASNGIGVRGHTLVWHSQTPVWFFKDDFKPSGEWVTPEVMDKRMESYIKNMFETIKTQYPDLDLYAYDVVNEAVSDDNMRGLMYGGAREPGDNNASQGKSAWVQVYGDNSFIEKAFVYARKYAPEGCKLFYNDYNEYWDHKRDRIYDMCRNLYEKGLLDGIGMQSHVNADMNGFSGAANHAAAMKKYLTIGCEVEVTELDISCEGGKYTPEQQAEKCKSIFKTAMECNSDPSYPGKVTAVCIWGPNDANTWISPANSPLLYDTKNEPKAAYNELIAMIPESEWGDGSSPAKADLPRKEINLGETELDKVTAVKAKEKEEKEESPAEKPDKAGEGSYDDGFEDGDCGWFGRGSAAVAQSGDSAASGDKSLFISGRSDAWNGASKALDPAEFTPGYTYSFSVNVMFTSGGDTDTFYMKLQYTDGNGATQYASVAEGEAKNGEWTLLENGSYEIPSDAENMQIYVETASSTNDFYIDDASGHLAS